jgi:hypothetical protein
MRFAECEARRFHQHGFADPWGGAEDSRRNRLALELRYSPTGMGSSSWPCDPGQNRLELGGHWRPYHC